MNTLLTRCPGCRTAFRVTEAQLALAAGLVRCGACEAVFEAGAHRFDEPEMPQAAAHDAINAGYIDELLREAPAPSADARTFEAAAANGADALPAEAQEPTDPDEGEPDNSAPVAEPAPAPHAPLVDVPVEVDLPAPAAPRWRRAVWPFISLLLLAALALQYAWHTREAHAQDPRWRPHYERACAVLGCTIPPYRDAARIRSSALLIHPDPARPGVLFLDAVITNHAAFAQSFPAMHVRFSDIDGKPVAERVFAPREYLGESDAAGALMPSRQAVRVHLELMDPGEHATNYELQLQELPQPD